MVAMMVGGIWIIVDPTGTVGALGRWADQASLGTLAVAARGHAERGHGRRSASSLGTLFAAAIEAPWCYLEFGDVGWCREPSRLDPRLRAAALKIAAEELAPMSAARRARRCAAPACRPAARRRRRSSTAPSCCATRSSNGAIFLALPANGPARNSINDQGSLLRTLCQSSEATQLPRSGRAAGRVPDGRRTRFARLGGLVLIAGGLLGMLLLLGFVAVRLLLAASFSLLYLLLPRDRAGAGLR